MVKVKTTNQEFPIPEAWIALADQSEEAKKQRDARIRRNLSSYIPAITNGQLTYKEENGETVVQVVPQLGTKAAVPLEEQELPSFFFLSGMHCNLDDVHVLLRDASPYLPLTLNLAWTLKWLQVTGQLTFKQLLDYQPKIRKALESNSDASMVEHIHQRLRDLPAATAPAAPLGF